MKKTLLTTLLMPFLAWNLQASDVEIFYWQMTPEGDASVGSSGQSGTSVNLEDDLGYDEEEGIVGGKIILGGVHQIGFSYFALDTSGENRIDRNITFADSTFSVRETVSSSLELQMAQVFYRMLIGTPQLRVAAVAGGAYVTFDAEASSDRIGTVSESAEAGMPFIGGAVEAQPRPWLSLRGQVTGGSWDFDKVSADYLDYEATLRLQAGNGLYAGIGYRGITVEATDDDIPLEVDIDLTGPMAFVGFHW